MSKFLFKTQTHSKNDKFWIDYDIIKDFYIEANNVQEATKKYFEQLQQTKEIEISKSAIKNKQKMYRDLKDKSIQVGYVVTGKNTFFDNDDWKWHSFFVSLWIEILEIKYPKF